MPSAVKNSLRYGRGQIWSQLEDSWILCDKAKLHKLLKSAGRLDLQPETYYLSDAQECKDFFTSATLNPETIWVTKEPTASQGDGITVNPDVKTLKEKYLVDPAAPVEEIQCKMAQKEIIAQRYILNPLLLEGKKMEIRTYWVVLSVEPLIVVYRDGTVRLTTRDYSNDNWNDPLVHITNTKQQKKADPNYHNTVADRKWTLDTLATYLQTNGKIQDAEAFLTHLRSQLEERIRVAVKEAHPQLLAKKTVRGWDGRFEMMGMDVILDENLYPWLTELQDGPGLSLDPGIKQHVVPKLIRELVDVVLEIDLTVRSNHQLPYPLRSLGEWRQIDLRKK
jgi:tubulin polyglutamylase TTLL9